MAMAKGSATLHMGERLKLAPFLVIFAVMLSGCASTLHDSGASLSSGLIDGVKAELPALAGKTFAESTANVIHALITTPASGDVKTLEDQLTNNAINSVVSSANTDAINKMTAAIIDNFRNELFGKKTQALLVKAEDQLLDDFTTKMIKAEDQLLGTHLQGLTDALIKSSMATIGAQFDQTLKPRIDAEVQAITTNIVTGIDAPLKSDIAVISNTLIKVEVIGGVVIAGLLAALGFLFIEHQKLKRVVLRAHGRK